MVQDPAEAEYSDMPENAMRDLPVTFCLRLAEIGPALDLLARRGTAFETGLSASVRMLKERVKLLQRLLDQSTRNVDTHDFLVFELAALQRDLHATQTLLSETLTGGGGQLFETGMGQDFFDRGQGRITPSVNCRFDQLSV
jgi:hypothetical protein